MRPLRLIDKNNAAFTFAGSFHVVEHGEKITVYPMGGDAYEFPNSVANKQALEQWVS